MSAAAIFWISAGVIVLLLGLVEIIAQVGGKGFLATVVRGQDGRTSTSKTFILLWTLLVAWALVALLIAGKIVDARACSAGSDLAAAAKACAKGHSEVGLLQVGWKHFLHGGLGGSYLVLLGIPAAAAVAAKGITQAKVDAGSTVKTKPPTGIHPMERLAEIFSADDGTTDVGDFQYVIFNLITAAYFVTTFVNPDGNGLPTIPETLLGLTGVSAALYVGKKAITRTEPKVLGVIPSLLHPGESFIVVGTGLSDPAQPDPIEPLVTINGRAATDVKADAKVADRLTGTAPADLIPAGTPAGAVTAGTVEVVSQYGVLAPAFPIQCS